MMSSEIFPILHITRTKPGNRALFQFLCMRVDHSLRDHLSHLRQNICEDNGIAGINVLTRLCAGQDQDAKHNALQDFHNFRYFPGASIQRFNNSFNKLRRLVDTSVYLLSDGACIDQYLRSLQSCEQAHLRFYIMDYDKHRNFELSNGCIDDSSLVLSDIQVALQNVSDRHIRDSKPRALVDNLPSFPDRNRPRAPRNANASARAQSHTPTRSTGNQNNSHHSSISQILNRNCYHCNSSSHLL